MLNEIQIFFILYLLCFFIPFFVGFYLIYPKMKWKEDASSIILYSMGFGLIGTGIFLILFGFSINRLKNDIIILNGNMSYYQTYSSNLVLERNISTITGNITYLGSSFEISLAVASIGFAIVTTGWSYIATIDSKLDDGVREASRQQQQHDVEQRQRDLVQACNEDYQRRLDNLREFNENIERQNKQEYYHNFFKILKKLK
jgi:hypothetical protein